MRVAAEQGIEAVSLRHVATEAGVTSGMVQHYFPTKEAMMDFAMQVASARYETRMTKAITQLGEQPPASELIRAILGTLLPTNESQRADGRVALAFQSYAATKPSAAEQLSHSNAEMRQFLAHNVRVAQTAGEAPSDLSPFPTATSLHALAEGLGVLVLSSNLSVEEAQAALNTHLDLIFST